MIRTVFVYLVVIMRKIRRSLGFAVTDLSKRRTGFGDKVAALEKAMKTRHERTDR